MIGFPGIFSVVKSVCSLLGWRNALGATLVVFMLWDTFLNPLKNISFDLYCRWSKAKLAPPPPPPPTFYMKHLGFEEVCGYELRDVVPWTLVALQAIWIFLPPLIRLTVWVSGLLIHVAKLALTRLRLAKRSVKEHMLPNYMTFESTFPGSEMVPKDELPACQCLVLGTVELGADPVVVGSAFRLGDHLVTAWHVIDPLKEIWLSSKAAMVSVRPEDWQDMQNDVALLRDNTTLNKLSLKKPKIASVGTTIHASQFVSIAAKKPHYQTMGQLKASPTNFFVVYYGTTSAGFSGAPYMSANTVYGMHIGANSNNIGLDATYLQAVCRSTQESDPNWGIKEDTYELIDNAVGKFARLPKSYVMLTDEQFDQLLEKKQTYGRVTPFGRSWADWVEEEQGYNAESAVPKKLDQFDNKDSENSHRVSSKKEEARVGAYQPHGALSTACVDNMVPSYRVGRAAYEEPLSSQFLSATNAIDGKGVISNHTLSVGNYPAQPTHENPTTFPPSTAAQCTKASPVTQKSMSLRGLQRLHLMQENWLKQSNKSGTSSKRPVIKQSKIIQEMERVNYLPWLQSLREGEEPRKDHAISVNAQQLALASRQTASNQVSAALSHNSTQPQPRVTVPFHQEELV